MALMPFHSLRALTLVTLCCSCGGEATSDGKANSVAPKDAGGTSSGGLPSASGGNGAGLGASASGGAGSDEGTGAPPLLLGDEGLPLFAGGEMATSLAETTVDETGREGVLSIAVTPDAPRGSLSTHLHNFNFAGSYSSVQFSARASRTVDLVVTISPLNDTYWEALAKGQPWQGAKVTVTPEWQDYTVIITEMGPLAEGEAQPLGTAEGSALTFLIEENEDTTVWLDDLALVP